MKLHPTIRYRQLIFAGMLFLALAFGALDQVFFGTSLQAQTNAPTAAAGDKDKDTGKPIITTPSGLKYEDLVAGTGPAAKTGDHLVVNYEGRLSDGTKFDSSYDRNQPFEINLGVTQVIQGWTEGLAGMKAGSIRKLIIPPQLGYGLNGAGDVIPPNATLIFKVEIVAINPK
jgi:peptidylprolyl isomerase